LLPVFAIATAAGRKSGSAYSTVIIIGRSTIEIEGETAVFDDIGSNGFMLRADIARAAGRHSRQNPMRHRI
jgi:hypothetical protein